MRLLWRDHRGLLLRTHPAPPLLDPETPGPQSVHISPRKESVRVWVLGDTVEGGPQRERGPECVQALSENVMNT